MKVVVDTNIIFSAILNSIGTIGELLFNSENQSEFHWVSAYILTLDVDEKDTPFIATALSIGGIVWTGDKKTYHWSEKEKVQRYLFNIRTNRTKKITKTTCTSA